MLGLELVSLLSPEARFVWGLHFGSSACMTITSPALPWEHLEWYDWSTWILGFQTNIWIVEELHLLLLWSVLFGVHAFEKLQNSRWDFSHLTVVLLLIMCVQEDCPLL